MSRSTHPDEPMSPVLFLREHLHETEHAIIDKIALDATDRHASGAGKSRSEARAEVVPRHLQALVRSCCGFCFSVHLPPTTKRLLHGAALKRAILVAPSLALPLIAPPRGLRDALSAAALGPWRPVS
jgi:hypothetical protein